MTQGGGIFLFPNFRPVILMDDLVGCSCEQICATLLQVPFCRHSGEILLRSQVQKNPECCVTFSHAGSHAGLGVKICPFPYIKVSRIHL